MTQESNNSAVLTPSVAPILEGTILVTGGSGFLGSHIVEQLSKAGRPVRALVRKTSNTSFLSGLPGVELFEGAVDDRSSLKDALAGVSGVIHAAGLVKARRAEEFNEINATGTVNVLEAARQHRETIRRFVLVSSLAVAGPSQDGSPVADDCRPNPVTHYGRSKLAAERAALSFKDELPITIIRPPLLYGPRDKECLAFFKAVKSGFLPYIGSTNNTCSAVYGADAARACIKALDRSDTPSGRTYFIDDGKVLTLAKLVEHIENAMGMRARVRLPIPRLVLKTAAFGSELYGRATNRAMMLTRDKCNELTAPHWVCSAERAGRELDWQAQVQFGEGARLTAEWYRQNRWI